MNLSARIFLAYFLLAALSVWSVMQSVTTELIPGMRQALEEVLIDTSNVLAELVREEMVRGGIERGDFANGFSAYKQRRLSSQIYNHLRTDTDLEIYITDGSGIVLYDSTGRNVGEDFSQWNDVYLTLRGRYGARTTRSNPDDESSSVMHVAAPIVIDGEIIGVLTVSKPSSAVIPYLNRAASAIKTKTLSFLLLSLVVMLLISWWLTSSIRVLTGYARRVRKGERVSMPRLRERELSQLAEAMEAMRVSLEGKDYVENYLHTLTHELKSPLTAIQSAAELLQDELPAPDRRRFADNIARESSRLHQVVEQLLRLAELEKRRQVRNPEAVDTAELITGLAEQKVAILKERDLRIDSSGLGGAMVSAERFLLQQAISNLLDNAISFSPSGGTVRVSDKVEQGRWTVTVEDQGPGIPDYALERVFERFYSLPRPDGGGKSTGLGLSLVSEVAALHKGEVRVENGSGGGARVHLSLPLDG